MPLRLRVVQVFRAYFNTALAIEPFYTPYFPALDRAGFSFEFLSQSFISSAAWSFSRRTAAV
jgi:hypothetical protein